MDGAFFRSFDGSDPFHNFVALTVMIIPHPRRWGLILKLGSVWRSRPGKSCLRDVSDHHAAHTVSAWCSPGFWTSEIKSVNRFFQNSRGVLLCTSGQGWTTLFQLCKIKEECEESSLHWSFWSNIRLFSLYWSTEYWIVTVLAPDYQSIHLTIIWIIVKYQVLCLKHISHLHWMK